MRMLGRGATGVVVQARDERLARDVAVKLAPANAVSARMLEEARALAQLQRAECVVQVWETASGQLASSTYTSPVNYIVMELVLGITLRQWQQPKRELADLLNVYANVAVGLHRVHAAGIAHGDIKPDNVIVDATSVPTLVDFGFAASMHESGVGGWRDEVVGTPPYMGPEVQAGEVGRKGDVHAYAVSLWEAVTGVLPFSATEERDARAKVGVLPFEDQVPRALRKVLKRAMSARSAHRPSIDEVHAAVLRATRPALSNRVRSLGAWGALAVVVAGVVGLSIRAVSGDEGTATAPVSALEQPSAQPGPHGYIPTPSEREAIIEQAKAAYRLTIDAWNSGTEADYLAGYEDPLACFYGGGRARESIRLRDRPRQFGGGIRTTLRIQELTGTLISPTQVVLHEIGTHGADAVNRRLEMHKVGRRWRVRQEELFDREGCWRVPVPE